MWPGSPPAESTDGNLSMLIIPGHIWLLGKYNLFYIVNLFKSCYIAQYSTIMVAGCAGYSVPCCPGPS